MKTTREACANVGDAGSYGILDEDAALADLCWSAYMHSHIYVPL